MPEFRAHFDAVVEFANGGDLTARGFRLDLPSADVDERELGRLLVEHLGLALVASVRFDRLEIVEEPHRGSRGIASRAEPDARRVVDLSGAADSAGPILRAPAGVDLADLVDLPAEVLHLLDLASPGIPAEVLFDRDLRAAAVLLRTRGEAADGAVPFLTIEAAHHLARSGAALVGTDALELGGSARSALLAAGVPVVEALAELDRLPPRGARFSAVPPPATQPDATPVRAFAVVG